MLIFFLSHLRCFIQTLADLVQESDLEVGRLYPPLQNITQCSVKIATNVMKAAYQTSKNQNYRFDDFPNRSANL